jgi:hypothetical protein
MPDFKVDRKNKTFVFDDGEVLPIPEKDQREVLRSTAAKKDKQSAKELFKKEKESGGAIGATKSHLKNAFGNPGNAAMDYITSTYGALSPGEDEKEVGFIDRITDRFYAKQEGYKEHLGELDQEYPTASLIGKGLGMGAELAGVGRLPAAAQLPIIGSGHSDTSFLEPWEKAKELGKDAVTGYALDRFFGALSKQAGARGEHRAARSAIAEAEAANAAEAGRFAEQTAAREANIANMPGMQQAENAAWAESQAGRVDKTAKALGATPIEAGVLGVEEFVENNIGRSAHAATTEGNRVARFLQSVFKGDKAGKMTSENLSKGMKALDQAIVTAEGAEKQLLNEFRDNLLNTLPERATNAFVFEKWGNKLSTESLKGSENVLTNALSQVPEVSTKLGKDFSKKLNVSINDSVKGVFNKYKGNLLEALESGEIKTEIMEAIQANPYFQKLQLQVSSGFPNAQNISKELAYDIVPGYKNLENLVNSFPETIFEKTSRLIDKNIVNIQSDFLTKSGNIGRNVSKLAPAPAPLPQPAPVPPPNVTPVPQMQAPRNLHERLAAGLENLNIGQTLKGMRRNAPAGALAGMAGIPVAKAAATGLGLAKGSEILTRPGAIPNAVRATFKQGGIEAIESWAQRYPSYNNGVLENPMERRSLTKEIENDQDMPIEVKAMMQSKVNRGKPLSSLL